MTMPLTTENQANVICRSNQPGEIAAKKTPGSSIEWLVKHENTVMPFAKFNDAISYADGLVKNNSLINSIEVIDVHNQQLQNLYD